MPFKDIEKRRSYHRKYKRIHRIRQRQQLVQLHKKEKIADAVEVLFNELKKARTSSEIVAISQKALDEQIQRLTPLKAEVEKLMNQPPSAERDLIAFFGHPKIKELERQVETGTKILQLAQIFAHTINIIIKEK